MIRRSTFRAISSRSLESSRKRSMESKCLLNTLLVQFPIRNSRLTFGIMMGPLYFCNYSSCYNSPNTLKVADSLLPFTKMPASSSVSDSWHRSELNASRLWNQQASLLRVSSVVELLIDKVGCLGNRLLDSLA